jgi:hypothetical protein
MRFVVAVATFAWAAQFSGPAAADLYRWVDPDSGSIKFSNSRRPGLAIRAGGARQSR